MEQFVGVIIALVFNVLDILTGLTSALKNGNIVSSKMRDGLFKKLAFILCYFVAWLIDNYGYTVGFTISIKILPVIVLYVCATELVSILENIEKINPNLSISKLKKMFHLDEIKKIDEDEKGEKKND